MGPEQHRLTPAERDNLVAYLDGELGEGEVRAIATKLTQSPTARREVEALQKTWELLEYLPRPEVSEDFTTRTLIKVQQFAAEGGKFEAIAKQVAPLAARVALGTDAALLAFGLGFLVTHWVWPNQTAWLARDLPIAEHLEEYQDVGTFDFLCELVDSPEFKHGPRLAPDARHRAEDADADPSPPGPPDAPDAGLARALPRPGG